ncbi:hypothetical protein SUGI_0848500 [Cryptomeria japonica]|uniref:uncharacterized protein LOC131077285 n=1 Tax=Cryptomeria japonica TaxID=3369 RepID=UPI0024147E87|nr:uncharacterized protein LOC131077285 [Cryptomeria japonica]GLJ40987.1 hypothetical protein SUGI_0848500 [Cryptomeria japonica]
MQDPITELPPPSRFQVGDLNNFVTPDKSLSLPHPFVAWARTLDSPPKLLLIALSKAACHLVHYLPSKTLMGTFVLPEISMLENTIEPSVQDKSCLLYSPKGDPTVMLASVQYAVSEERAVVWAKALLREVRPEAVVIAASIPSMHFRGKLSNDETLLFKLETLAQRRETNSDLNDVPYFPSGSVVDGPAAALLTQCQMAKLKARLIVSWPEYDTAIVRLLGSLFNRVCPSVDFSVPARTPLIKALRLESDLYT